MFSEYLLQFLWKTSPKFKIAAPNLILSHFLNRVIPATKTAAVIKIVATNKQRFSSYFSAKRIVRWISQRLPEVCLPCFRIFHPWKTSSKILTLKYISANLHWECTWYCNHLFWDFNSFVSNINPLHSIFLTLTWRWRNCEMSCQIYLVFNGWVLSTMSLDVKLCISLFLAWQSLKLENYSSLEVVIVHGRNLPSKCKRLQKTLLFCHFFYFIASFFIYELYHKLIIK